MNRLTDAACFGKIRAMILVIVTSLRHFLGWTVSAFSSRQNLILENLAFRQQLLALHAKRPRRRLTTLQKLFWVVLLRLWSEWERALVLVTPRTVVGWHRAGFRLYGTWVSRARRVGGRRRVRQEVRALIFRMAAENPTWGAPRIVVAFICSSHPPGTATSGPLGTRVRVWLDGDLGRAMHRR